MLILLVVWLLVNREQLEKDWGESQVVHEFSTAHGERSGIPNPRVIQGSSVLLRKLGRWGGLDVRCDSL